MAKTITKLSNLSFSTVHVLFLIILRESNSVGKPRKQEYFHSLKSQTQTVASCFEAALLCGLLRLLPADKVGSLRSLLKWISPCGRLGTLLVLIFNSEGQTLKPETH